MKHAINLGQERGIALAVSLLFLLIVTIISVAAASNSALGLKISANMQDAYASFQSAEAGIVGVMLQTNDPSDPNDIFADRFNTLDIDSNDLHLSHLKGGADSVAVDVYFTDGDLACPAIVAAFSDTFTKCDFYRIESEHVAPNQARTKVDAGVYKPLISES